MAMLRVKRASRLLVHLGKYLLIELAVCNVVHAI